MDWSELEKCFNRAIAYTACQKKWSLAFLGLSLCGLFFLICYIGALKVGDWLALGLLLAPGFMSLSILLSLGAILTRLYGRGTEKTSLSWQQFFFDSSKAAIESFYFSLPTLLAYLALWIFLGAFYLFRALPVFGDFFGVIFAFGPFLLILASLLLGLFHLSLLFLLPPALTLFPSKKWSIVKEIFGMLRNKLFTSLALFLIALFPLALGGLILYMAIYLSALRFFVAESIFPLLIQWLLVMIPFSALFAPLVVFFFNFSMESVGLLRRQVNR